MLEAENEDLINIFKETLTIADKYFDKPVSKFYRTDKQMKITWSEDTVASIFAAGGHVAALNFADDRLAGGIVWQGASTQEECLCRCSNLYRGLEGNEYYNVNGGIIYSKDVVFFRDSEYKLVKPKRCDIISCAALGTDEEIKEKMRMILMLAKVNGVDELILGRWGCGAFGRDWEEMKKYWQEILKERAEY